MAVGRHCRLLRPRVAAIITNANALARYVALCQEGDIVPIVNTHAMRLLRRSSIKTPNFVTQ